MGCALSEVTYDAWPAASREVDIEIMYIPNEMIQSLSAAFPQGPIYPAVSGDWTTDAEGRVCTSMRTYKGGGPPLSLPTRCHYWFKLKDDYFLADSDSDPKAKVIHRTVKQ
jgi:hypothetical protein